jgi:hypothetical protein
MVVNLLVLKVEVKVMKTHGNVTPRGIDRRAKHRRQANQDTPRDDLTKAYSGNENKGPAGNQKKGSAHDTHVKNRKRGVNINGKNEPNATEL